MKFKILVLSVIFISNIFSQNLDQPKLVVGIVIDQMRFEDLYRYYNYFEKDGFKKLLNYGANFTYAHFNYEPTTTAPGHSSIFTGSVPYFHGIVANDFFDKKIQKVVNAVKDENYLSVGSDDEVGKCSPNRLQSSTISDQIKLSTNLQSKVISISLKDRGAVLPGGQLANAAYWYNYKTGDFISSTYYMKSLPDWLVKFNDRNLPQDYMQKGWNLLLKQEAYNSLYDLSQENKTKIFKEDQIKFPYDFKNLSNEELNNSFQFTPYANQILVDLVKEIIINENLGKDNIPDFISISFSATDIIGHTWGNFSLELMDTYIRLDRTIAELISFLNNIIGEKNYLLFLTSDHGAIQTPSVMKNINAITGELNTKSFYDSLKSFAANNFGSEKIILNFSNRQIYLDRNFIKEHNLEFDNVMESFANYLRDNFNAIHSIMTRKNLEKLIANRIPQSTLLNGWNPSVSGDIIFNLKPGYLNNFMQSGTTHSSAYSYDTHIPLIFYGWKIPAKEINNLVYVTDIAATIANLLKINPPNACIGIPLSIYWE
jgi:predicted AlkP superfamily pyrophosphatase or phosphodiesterase